MNRRFHPLLPLSVLMVRFLACGLFNGTPTVLPVAVTVEPRAVVTPVYVPPSVDIVALEDTLVRLYEQVNPGVVALFYSGQSSAHPSPLIGGCHVYQQRFAGTA